MPPNVAHELLKQALATRNTNLNLRAFYVSSYKIMRAPLPRRRLIRLPDYRTTSSSQTNVKNLHRRVEEDLTTEKEFEAEAQARLDTARQKGQEKQQRRLRRLAVKRQIVREQALEWTREVQLESDEERERKSER
ncbi:hypothetical protein BDN67DRAFT_967908 [Paxillus ammoniavirescens]|nr:hypothetical protein BDN67DRAFT_967908 [Paxillus ammoniavirescens]